MRVVLLELANAREPAECARNLIAMQHILRRVANGQLAIGVLGVRVKQVVRWTVHRLQREVVFTRFVSSTRNMFSRYLPQWPDNSHSVLLNISGVFTC